MQTRAALKLTVVLLAATALSGYSFQADDLTPGLNRIQQPALVKAQKSQSPTAQQLEAAQSLPDIDVKWDSKTGTPLSIRGPAIASKNLGGKGLTISGKGDYARNAIAVLDSLTSVYRLQDASSEFLVEHVESDNLGFHHARITQVYQGLRVVGGALIVHFDGAGQAYQVNGSYIPDLAIPIEPKLDKSAAVNAAQLDLAAMGKPQGELKGEPELVIYARNSSQVLAYELILTYVGTSGMGRWCYWVDANNGAIVNRYNDIHKVTIQGNILTGEGGQNVSVEGTYQSPYYYLYNSYSAIRNGDDTGSYPDSSSGGNYYPAYRTSSDWSTSDRTEMSAAYNFYLIQSYYYSVHGRSGYDNAGAQANAYVHFPGGTDNAYWSPDYQSFFFYPGSTMTDLTILDITGHEFTHAVTEKTANLTYQNEPGALNESFSDIFGALIEFAYQPDGRSLYPNKQAGYADWLVAEDASISTVCMRDMRNPSSSYTLMYAQGYPQPSQYQDAYWYSGDQDNGGVHVNSGVQNHFFYLLCEGGSGFSGIGISNARQVAYRTLTVYCSQNTDYNAVRTAWISAAQDLNSGWVSTVEAAWNAVNVTGGGGGGNAYYAYFLYYYSLYQQSYSQYQATGSYYYLAYTYYYYAYASWFYYMYQGDSASADAYYNYYMYYAQYYYDLYQTQSYQYYLTYYEYSSIYYSYYLQTGNYYYLAYSYYYYAYAAYWYYMYYGDSSSANAYYNYYMYWAQYYYDLAQYQIADKEKPAA